MALMGNSRGGARPGAGRPRAIGDPMRRLAIGARCEGLWHDAWARNLEQAIADAFAASDYATLISSAHSIPIGQRAAWLRSEDYETHAADVEEERRTLASMDATDDRPAPRLFRFEGKRPKGVKPRIIAAVAAWETEQNGETVSQRQVRECWDEYRRTINALKSNAPPET